MKKKKWKTKMYLMLAVCTVIGTSVFGTAADSVYAGNVTIERKGYSKYGGRSCGNFFLDGERAFCLEHRKSSPATGTTATEVPYENQMIKSVLYYGWGGAGNLFTDEAEGVVRTSFALTYLYTGETHESDVGQSGLELAKPLLDYAKAHLVGDMTIRFDKETPEVSFCGGEQRTESIRVSGDTRNTLTFSLPKGVSLCHEQTGQKETGTVTVKGQETFYLTAPYEGAAEVQTGKLSGSMGYCAPVIYQTKDPDTQDLIRLVWQDGPVWTSLHVKWKKTGRIGVHKVDAETHTPDMQNQEGGFAGTEYTIYAGAEHDCYAQGEIVETLILDANGEACSNRLPEGEYVVCETKAPTGYRLDETSYRVTIPAKDGDESIQWIESADWIIRGDFCLKKAEKGTSLPLAGVLFSITNLYTNETATFVTDENGIYNSTEDSLRFGQGEAKGSHGSLPWGTYLIEELPCEANQGRELVQFELEICEDEVVTDLGIVWNEPVPVEVPKVSITPTPIPPTVVETVPTGDFLWQEKQAAVIFGILAFCAGVCAFLYKIKCRKSGE